MDKAKFHPYGIVVSSPDGDVVLNAGSNMTILPQGDLITFNSKLPPNVVINNLTPWQPPTLTDATAPNNSVYFSSDVTKLVYKDSTGSVHALY